MKIKFRNVVFDELTIETNQGKIIDTSKENRPIELDKVSYAWGYICKECLESNRESLGEFIEGRKGEDIEGVICYVDSCSSLDTVYEFSLTNEENQELKFI